MKKGMFLRLFFSPEKLHHKHVLFETISLIGYHLLSKTGRLNFWDAKKPFRKVMIPQAFSYRGYPAFL
jgi:hypothetical protein